MALITIDEVTGKGVVDDAGVHDPHPVTLTHGGSEQDQQQRRESHWSLT